MYQILLLILITCIRTQVQITKNHTLIQLAVNHTNNDTLLITATNHLLQTHPQFAQYNVISVNQLINRTVQTYATNLKDYLFQLHSNNTRIRALVTISNLKKQSYVTVSPIVSAPLQPLKGKYGPLIEYFPLMNKSSEAISEGIINQSISNNNQSALKKQAPSSYILYQDEQDPLLQFALDYVASVHPNIINYKLSKEIYYQLVAGTNIKIHYVGYDKYSEVTAVVYFDLKLVPLLVSFEVDCVSINSTCNAEQVWNVYQSVEWILMYHPGLFGYKLVDVKVLDGMAGDEKMRVVLTFQNVHDKLRSLLEVQISMARVSVLSYYTYCYQQQ